MTGLKLIDVGSHGSSQRSLAMPLLKTRAKDGEGISTSGMVGGGQLFPCFSSFPLVTLFFSSPRSLNTNFLSKRFNKGVDS